MYELQGNAKYVVASVIAGQYIEQCPPLTLRLSWRIFHFQHSSSCDKYGPLLHIQSVPLDFHEGAAISAVTKSKRWRSAVFIFLSVRTLDINGCGLSVSCHLQKWSQNIPDMNDGDVINDWMVITRPYTHPQPGLRCLSWYFNPFLWQTSAWQATTLGTFIWGVLFLVWPISCLIWLTLQPTTRGRQKDILASLHKAGSVYWLLNSL